MIGLVADESVRVLNLSLGGIGLECPKALRVDKTYPVVLSGHGEVIELPGTARWCHAATDRNLAEGEMPPYNAGLRFVLRVEELHALYSFLGAELAQQSM
ncbi:MAG TPA: PilZ domain-containing protein [Thermoanaerobaculia bacterium]|nr:PilZ domain-containing protein [Thermoanaerobaculia bacterium]